jgi:hypothetical protein
MTDLDPEARRLVDLTREARTPSMGDRARIERMLAASLLLTGASVAHTGSAAAATKTASAALGVKWVAGIAVAAAVGTAGYFGWDQTRAKPPVERTADPGSEHAVAHAPPVPEAPGTQAAEPVLVAPVHVPASEQTEARPDARRAGKGAERDGTLLEELDLLHEAQAKWRKGDAAGALALLSVHRTRYPKSQVVPERDALTVLSLCSMNRTAEAKKVAQRFLRTASRSPLRTSVEESCGGSSLK